MFFYDVMFTFFRIFIDLISKKKKVPPAFIRGKLQMYNTSLVNLHRSSITHGSSCISKGPSSSHPRLFCNFCCVRRQFRRLSSALREKRRRIRRSNFSTTMLSLTMLLLFVSSWKSSDESLFHTHFILKIYRHLFRTLKNFLSGESFSDFNAFDHFFGQ